MAATTHPPIAEHARMSADAWRTALKLAGAAIYEWRPGTPQMVWVDPGVALRTLGLNDPEQITDADAFHALLPDSARTRRERLIALGVDTATPMRLEYPVRTPDGLTVWVEERAAWIQDDDGPARLVGVLRNIQSHKRRERALAASALEDDLTGLMTRTRLSESMERALSEAGRRGAPLAYMALAIDDLSALNLRFGFDVADQVIAAIGRRLAEAAGGYDLVGRIAGNKFGVMLGSCGPDRVEAAVRRLMRASCRDVAQTSIGPVEMTLSAGAVAFQPDGRDTRDIMARAEAALDMAKRGGPGSVVVADQEPLDEGRRARHAAVASSIVDALREDRIAVAYQPIIAPSGGALQRMECLARLLDREGRTPPNAAFIDVAEATGLIRRVDLRVLEKAKAVLAAHPDLHVSVNVSGATVASADDAKAYVAQLRQLGPAAPRMTVELTETSVVEAHERVLAFAQAVREIGGRFSVDDFGAGYTSFRQLQAIEPDEVKIDGAFIRGVSDDPRQQSFVEALVKLARSLSVSVIAEFVETEADAAVLEALGVQGLQGLLGGLPQMTLPDGV